MSSDSTLCFFLIKLSYLIVYQTFSMFEAFANFFSYFMVQTIFFHLMSILKKLNNIDDEVESNE